MNHAPLDRGVRIVLATGQCKYDDDPSMPFKIVQSYLRSPGRRKCEANSIVVVPKMGRQLCEKAILKHLGADAIDRFEAKNDLAREKIDGVLDDSGARKHIQQAIKRLQKYGR